MIVRTLLTRCDEYKSNGVTTITSLEGVTKECNTAPGGIDETEIKTKEKNMIKKKPRSENLERLLVTAKEAPAYNREVLFLIIRSVSCSILHPTRRFPIHPSIHPIHPLIAYAVTSISDSIIQFMNS